MKIVQEISRFEIVCHTKVFNKNIYTLHWHDKFELCQVLKNDCKFLVDGKTINASAGDIITIDENVVHQFIIEENETYVRICQLPLKILLTSQNDIDPLRIHIKAEEIEAVEGLSERLEMLFKVMEEEKRIGSTLDNSFLKSIATSVYLLLERHFSETHGVFSQERDRREFYKIVNYINKHFKEDITVEHIAKSLYFSRGRLSSAFKKFAGVGITEYINRLRVQNANYLLSQGMSITEAALDSGFQSIRTFNNVYKSIMHITPSEYIRKKQNNI